MVIDAVHPGVVFRLPDEQTFAPDSDKREKTGPPTNPAAGRLGLVLRLESV